MLICADSEFVLYPSAGNALSAVLCACFVNHGRVAGKLFQPLPSLLFSSLPLQNPFRIHNFRIISFYLSLAFYSWHYALIPIVNLTLWDNIKRWQSVTLCACMWVCVCVSELWVCEERIRRILLSTFCELEIWLS